MSGDDFTQTSRLSRSDEVTKRLLELVDRCNYQLVQENGQRRLTCSTTWSRMKGAEVFLGRLPRDCYEDELVPMLEKIGRVVELRLMMDFSGSTRGYAFALFQNPRIARVACDRLNGHEIRPGHRIGVVKSIDNCRLFLGGVPKDKTKDDFMIELSKMLDGITNIYLYPSTENKSLNRGFVFVEFKDHRSAAMARRKLIPGRVMLWDHEVAVDWADPEPGDDIDDEVMEKVTALFVRNLPPHVTETELRHTIQTLTSVSIVKVKKINHFAFLHYETREQARQVLDIMKQTRSVGFEDLEVAWAKPIRKSEKLQERLRCAVKENTDEGYRGKRGKSSNKKRENNLLDRGSDSDKSQSTMKTYESTDDHQTTTRKSMPMATNNDVYLYGGQLYTCDGESSAPSQCRKISKTGEPTLDDISKALAEFAANKLGAVLRYEYITDAERLTYGCKIFMERGGYVLMQYQGDPASTLQEALESTFRGAYISLHSVLQLKDN